MKRNQVKYLLLKQIHSRFQVFSDARVRNISEYHARCIKDNQIDIVHTHSSVDSRTAGIADGYFRNATRVD